MGILRRNYIIWRIYWSPRPF